jgi:alpha-tubulin suppressor-like RCC1 family protein
VLVPGIGQTIAIAAASFSVAVLTDGRALTWGENVSRSLGRAWKDDGTPAPTPAIVPGVANGRAVAVGNAHVLVLTHAGTLVSWGWDAFGQTGQGTANENGVPVGAVKGVTGVRSVTASGNSSYAFLNDGRIVCWGSGRSWISVRGGAADIRGRSNRTPILLNVDGLENG